jgi:hypothetical protein
MVWEFKRSDITVGKCLLLIVSQQVSELSKEPLRGS